MSSDRQSPKKSLKMLLECEDFQLPECIWGGWGSDPLLKAFPGRFPKYPLLVFINTRSGGQLGSALLQTFRKLLCPQQVFDLNEVRPDEVVSKLSASLNSLEAGADELLAALAVDVRKSLKLVVAGGDGTAGWILGAASDLKNPIPVATIPLGTGNNLPFTFGWGRKNPGTDVRSTRKFFKQLAAAHPLKVDRWQLTIVSEVASEDLPPALQPVSESQQEIAYSGSFWNYFSLGMDAQVSYQFHNERSSHPERFSNQLGNQMTYAKIGCTQGWFCASCAHPSSKNINEIGTVFVAENHGPWKKLEISSSIRSLVLLNLPSFSGGLNPWGTPNDDKSRKRGLTSTSVEDGKLELVGFRDGWHGLCLLFPRGHGTRLAQAERVRIEFNARKSEPHESQVYMRVDGEPWRQALPEPGRQASIEICRTGQGVMLARKGCIAEQKDAYQHRLSITRHGLKHGLELRSQVRGDEDDDGGSH